MSYLSFPMETSVVLVPPSCVVCGAHAITCVVQDSSIAFCSAEHIQVFFSSFDATQTLRKHADKLKNMRIHRGRPILPGGFNSTDLAVQLFCMHWSNSTPEWQNNQTRLRHYLSERGCGSTEFVTWCISVLDATKTSPVLDQNVFHHGLEVNSRTDRVDCRFLAEQLAMVNDCWRTGEKTRAKNAIMQTHKMLMYSVLYHQQYCSEPEVCLDVLDKKAIDIFATVLSSCVPVSALPRPVGMPTFNFHKATNIPMYQKVQSFVVVQP